MSLPRLLLLTDRAQLRLGRGLVSTITECVEAGLSQVVVREHDLAGGPRHALISTLAAISGLTVISSRISDPAAHGLHHSSGQPRTVEGGLAGRSSHSVDDLRRAAVEGFDYATLSPYAATPSKPGYGPALESSTYAAAPLPVFALGGITVDNAPAAYAAGAHGVAVMGAVMRSPDPAATVARLLEVVG